jgi:hypothetical protein
VSEGAPHPTRDARFATPIPSAAARGFAAFAVVAAAGQAIGFAEWFALHRPFGLRFPLKVGWLYFLAFHRVGVDVRGPGLTFLEDAGPPLAARVHLAFLTGTALALVVLFRAARRSVMSTRGQRASAGLSLVIGYALPSLVGSLVVTLRFPVVGATVVPVLTESFVMPMILAIVASAAAFAIVPASDGRSSGAHRLRACLIGGWWMLIAAVLLAIVGLVVLAGLRPDGAGAYWRAVTAGGSVRGTVIVGHQALLLPNQSIFLLAPAMGTCDEMTVGSDRRDLLCFGREPVASQLSGFFGGNPDAGDSMPTVFFLFVAVPATAVVLGGRRAGRETLRHERWLVGAGAGLVFAALVAAMAAAATIRLAFQPPGSAVAGGVTIGPELPAVMFAALLWGVVGGAIGALSVDVTTGRIDQEGEEAEA